MTRDPHASAPGLAVGVTEQLIETLVHAFYARVRDDPFIGPTFEAHIDDWDEHLKKLCRFWSSVTLMTGQYKGTPMHVQADLPGLQRAHFERWLAIFRATAVQTCAPDAAQLFVDRAERIAASLQLGIALRRTPDKPLADLKAK